MRFIYYLIFFFSFNSYSDNWFPLVVDVWVPEFNEKMVRQDKNYIALDTAKQPWKLCVSIPHLKDAYWMAVNFALVDEAKRLGLRMRIKEAGGYGRLKVQRKQIIDCMATGADALILSGVTHSGLNDLVQKYKSENKPVIDLINGIEPTHLDARSAVSYRDNASLIGEFLLKKVGNKQANIIWLPGPKGPTWSLEADLEFKQAIKAKKITILETLWGDTGREDQAKLIQQAMNKHKRIDYIIGTSVSAEAALDILTKNNLMNITKIIAYYYSPRVHRGILRGKILASASDKQGLQARIAVDMAVRAIEGTLQHIHAGPKVELITQENIRKFDARSSIPIKGFRPVFSVNDW